MADFQAIDSRRRNDLRNLKPLNRAQTSKTEEASPLRVTDSFARFENLPQETKPLLGQATTPPKADNQQTTPEPLLSEKSETHPESLSPAGTAIQSLDGQNWLTLEGSQVEAPATESSSLIEFQRADQLQDSSLNAPISQLESSPSADLPAAAPQQSFLSRVAGVVTSILGGTSEASFAKELKSINKLEAEMSALKTPADFQAKTQEFKERLAAGETLASIRPEAYAVARRGAQVSTGMRAFDCQVSGALAMDDGNIAEMKTGEGKTLTAIMPLYLNALAGKGAHLVTVNDTLASRDAEITKPAFNLLGLSVGTVLEEMTPEQRREGYNADITYTTDRTLGFDFLRDQTAKRAEDRVQREPFFALVDEVDEVLLDEARTPLVVSGKSIHNKGEYHTFKRLVDQLKPGDDYQATPETNAVWLTEQGLNWTEVQLQIQDIDQKIAASENPIEKARLVKDKFTCQSYAQSIRIEQAAERALKSETLTGEQKTKLEEQREQKKAQRKKLEREKPSFELYGQDQVHRTRYLEAALKAHVLFHKGSDYIVDEKGVQIVDKNKGRTSEGRRFSNGLHQALEAKEGVAIQDEQTTTATITYPNLFKRYPRLSGMTGTARTSQSELYHSYDLAVIPISTNKPLARIDEPDQVFKTQEDKYAAVARDAAADFFAGKPVLIGTLSVEHNRYVVAQLRKLGIPDQALQVLNAESVRGDKQIENDMIANAGRSGVVTVATNMAGRGANIKPDLINFKKISMEVAEAVDQGKPVVVELAKAKDAEWLGEWLGDFEPEIIGPTSKALPGPGQVTIRVGQRGIMPRGGQLIDGTSEKYETGGLTVYGTERAESRRIDDQLIGRAGRQGDKGRSKFYLSLEDELFQKHAGALTKGLESLFQEPGQGRSGKLFDKLIQNAQSNAEMTHAQLREKTNKTDEILNIHRTEFFGMRDQILDGVRNPEQQLQHMAASALVEAVLGQLPEKKNLPLELLRTAVAEAEKTSQTTIDLASLKSPQESNQQTKVKREEVAQQLYAQGQRLAQSALDATPEKETLRADLLKMMDDTWTEHLDDMDSLKASAQLQTYIEKDPDVFFKIEAAGLFGSTLKSLNHRALVWATERRPQKADCHGKS